MPTYNNPANMIPEQPWMAGGMRGAMAGLNGAYSMHSAEQGFRDSDQEHLSAMEKLKQLIREGEVRNAEGDTRISKAGVEKQWMDSGKALEEKNAGLDAVIAGTRNTNATAMSKEDELKGNFLAEAAQIVDTPGFHQNPENWKQIVEKGQAVGLKLPPTPRSQDVMMIKAKAAAYINSAKTQQAGNLHERNAETDLRTNILPQIAGRASIMQSSKEMDDKTKIEVAKIKADTSKQFKDLNQYTVNALARNIKMELATNGKISEETKREAIAFAEGEAHRILSDDENFKFQEFRATTAKDQKALSEVQARLDRETARVLNTIPGWQSAMNAKEAGETLPPRPNPQTQPQQGVSGKINNNLQIFMQNNPGIKEDKAREVLKAKGLL